VTVSDFICDYPRKGDVGGSDKWIRS